MAASQAVDTSPILVFRTLQRNQGKLTFFTQLVQPLTIALAVVDFEIDVGH